MTTSTTGSMRRRTPTDTGDDQEMRRGRSRERHSPTRSARRGADRRVRVPELSLGLLVVTGCALAALLWSRSLTATSTVVVAAGDLARGEVIDEDDLSLAEVRSVRGLGLVSGDRSTELVGRILLVDVSAGSTLVGAMVGDVPRLGGDEALVGVALERGHAPSDLAVGDRVQVILVPDPTGLTETAPTTLSTPARVWSIDPADEFEPRALVTLGLPVDQAAPVAAAHAVRLVRVER